MSVFDERGSGRAALARLGFADTAGSSQALERLGLWHDDRPSDLAAVALVEAAADATDPDLTVAQLLRLYEAADDPAALVRGLREREGLRRRLLAVFGTSIALGDHLVAHPGDWLLLADDTLVESRPSRHGLETSLLEAVGVTDGGEGAAMTGPAAVAALQVAHRRCLLLLAARDLTGVVEMAEVGGELADVASAVLSAGLAVARAETPATAPFRLAVIGMGKCGGRELNYVSDVDVVLVAAPVGETSDDAALRGATRLAQQAMRVCTAAAWPIDANLRPEGAAGPLVRTLASHLAYYRRWASTWEFQALVKARPVAGDIALGRAYVEAVAPLVWEAAGRPGFVDDVQAMRRRVESTLPDDTAPREVKLGPGGLRDIEFAVQLLQLVHGRNDPQIRSGTTLSALDALAAGGYVGREDARHLREAYAWLRTLEHRLQLHRLRRTHLLPAPDDAAGLLRVARAMGYRASALDTFGRERAGYGHEVRRLHEKLFYRPLLRAVARLPGEQARLTPAAAKARLEALGFARPAVALQHLEALTEGVSRRAVIQQTLLPAMLGWFADAADPDAGLLAFRQVSDRLGTTPWYLRLLRDEGQVAERLAHLLASSRLVADLLTRAPEAVRLLADDDELVPRPRAALETAFVATVARRSDPGAAVAAARGLRRHELLRIACADRLGRLTLPQVGTALSDVAAAVVAAALSTAVRGREHERGALPLRFAVLAMGRLGGGEQGYGSDADVLFVHDPHPGTSEADAAAIALEVAGELRRLLSLPAPDPPLHVDADLRPEGKQGPLSRSLASCVAYYEKWASGWEAQALLRAAPLAGDATLVGELLDAVADLRYPPGGLTADALRELRRIKARVERERLPRGADPRRELKLGPGGLADVEWTAQLLQLQHAHAVPALRTTGTLQALAAATAAGLLDPADSGVLNHAWTLASRVRNALVLVRGKPGDTLPAGGRELEGVARALGYPVGGQGQALDDYRRATRRARAVVERVFYA